MQNLTSSMENISHIMEQGALYYHKGVAREVGSDSALF